MAMVKKLLKISHEQLCFDNKFPGFVLKAWKHSSILNCRVQENCDSRTKQPSQLYTKQDGNNNNLSISSTLILNDDRKIPRFGLGVYDMEAKQTRKAVLWALENGYRLIDTASRYQNEKSVGEAVKESGVTRCETYIVTKVYRTDHGYSETLEAFNRSLSLLGLDYVDLYLIHFPVPEGVVATWKAMTELRDKGLIRSIGVSNFNIHHLKALRKQSDVIPAVNQIEVHPFLQMSPLVDYCKDNGIAIQAYSPLTRGRKLDDPALTSIANKYNKTSAQVLLRWCLQKGYICIPKSSHSNRIKENAAVFDFSISKVDMDALDGFEDHFRTGRDRILWPWNG